MNDTLENALKETWKKKDKFYEENKDLSILEILIKLEDKYGVQGNSPNMAGYASVQSIDRTPLKQIGVPADTVESLM